MTSATSPVERACRVAAAVVAVGCPCRLALVTASGPTRSAKARTKSWAGQRTPTVARPLPSRASSTSVSGPGQNASISRSASGGTASARTSTCSGDATSMAIGIDSGRSFKA